MIFWIDEQISPKFADWLAEKFQVVAHQQKLKTSKGAVWRALQ
jgi:hypothetical protein